MGGGAYYVSKTFGGNQGGAGGGANGVYLPSYWRYDAFASYVVNDRVNLQLNVQNLFDDLYYTQSFGNRGTPGPGRTFIFSVSWAPDQK